ncbi:FtsX-like permease family protein [Candidatus Sumerlaeota bacterium]|nr:FtsX-like permease family protein [Candidatus Sumerlaeota bacterium]
MNIARLTIKEILYRRENFFLGVLSVAVAVGILVGEFTLLDIHVFRNELLLRNKEQETREEMFKLQDDYRKIMKAMGYNLLLISDSEDLKKYYATGSLAHTMPEDYADKLSRAKLESVKHIQPCLEQETKWKEQDERIVIISGIGEENPLSYESYQEPILVPPPPDKIIIGSEIGESRSLKTGDRIIFFGETFEISRIHSPRGTRDDITIWISLDKAQKMLKQEGRINAIRALKCLCEGKDRESIIRDVKNILPDVRMIELAEKAETRGQVRERAKNLSGKTLEAEKNIRKGLRREKEGFISWLIPLVIIGCTTWTGLLIYSNVRERRREIAVLSALGFRSKHIMAVFVAKAFFMGLAGSFFGYIAGFATGILYGSHEAPLQAGMRLFNLKTMAAFMMAACFLSVLSSVVPALSAAGQNPADIFSRE